MLWALPKKERGDGGMDATQAIALVLSFGFLFVAATGYIHVCGRRPKK